MLTSKEHNMSTNNTPAKQYHDDEYLYVLDETLRSGTKCMDRTGTGTTKVFGRSLRFDLSDGTIPLLTTKKMHIPAILHEILWYLSGSSNIKYLQDNGVRIWNEWSTSDGHLKKVYGYQWRHWEKDDWLERVVEIKKRDNGIDQPFVPPVTTNQDQSSVDDDQPYAPTVLGHGCIGIVKEKYPFYARAYGLWRKLLERCYDVNSAEYPTYGAQGVFVDQEWRCFANFIRDIHDLPYFTRWVRNPQRYKLSKDYFGSMSYGKDTCIFLPSEYEQVLSTLSGAKYIATIAYTGETHEFTVPLSIATQTHYDAPVNPLADLVDVDWACETIFPRDGYVYRQQLYIDQIADVVHRLKTNPDDRRLIVSAWNVGDINEMKLPPCHFVFQFFTRELSLEERVSIMERTDPGIRDLPVEQQTVTLNDSNIPTRSLSCMMTQRSTDIFLGLPFNIAQYSIITRMMCEVVNMSPGEFIWNGGDCHVYHNHVEQALIQLNREPYPSPSLTFSRRVTDIDDFRYEDFVINEYQSHPAIKAVVSV